MTAAFRLFLPTKYFLATLVLLLGLTHGTIAQESNFTLEQFVELERRVVELVPKCMAASVGLGSKARPENGSAVVVSKEGLLLTAYHVVEGLPDNEMIVSFNDGTTVKAKKLGGNQKLDIAVAQIIDKGEYPFVEIGDMSSVDVGNWCVSISHAGGFQEDRTPPVRIGRVVNKNRNGFLQISATLIGGDSGGPTFDLDGKVIGIHSNIGGVLNQNQACPISDFTKKDHWQRLLDGEVWGKRGEEQKKARAEAERKKKEAEKKKKAELEKKQKSDNQSKEEQNPPKDELDSEESAKKDPVKSPTKTEPKAADSSDKAQEPKNQSGEDGKSNQSDVKESSPQETDQPEAKKDEPKQDGDTKDTEKKSTRKKPKNEPEPETSLAALEPLAHPFKDSIVRFWRRGRLITSGTIVSEDGLIVTKSSELMSRTFKVELPDGRQVSGKVVKRVKENDLLFVKVEGEFTPVHFWQSEQTDSASKQMPLGSIVVALGYGGHPVSMGVKSVEVRNLYQAGYAVLGVQLGSKQDDLSIKSLVGRSPAQKAGLKKGDVITKIGGVELKTLDQLREKLRSLEPNTRVPVEFEREGRVAATLVKLGSSFARSDKASQNYPQGGRISRKRIEFTNALQTDTPFDPIHVGAPLINLKGELLGLNIARAGRIKSYTLPCQTLVKEISSIGLSDKRED